MCKGADSVIEERLSSSSKKIGFSKIEEFARLKVVINKTKKNVIVLEFIFIALPRSILS